MKPYDFSSLFSENFGNAIPAAPDFPFDVTALMETQRKNVQAFSEIQQRAFENMQFVAQRQSELFSRYIQDNSSLAQEIIGEGTPEQKVSRQTDIIKTSYEKTVKDLKELGDIISKSNQEATDVINKRVSASLSEIKTALKKKKAA